MLRSWGRSRCCAIEGTKDGASAALQEQRRRVSGALALCGVVDAKAAPPGLLGQERMRRQPGAQGVHKKCSRVSQMMALTYEDWLSVRRCECRRRYALAGGSKRCARWERGRRQKPSDTPEVRGLLSPGLEKTRAATRGRESGSNRRNLRKVGCCVEAISTRWVKAQRALLRAEVVRRACDFWYTSQG